MFIIGQPREGVYQVYDTDDFSVEFLPPAEVNKWLKENPQYKYEKVKGSLKSRIDGIYACVYSVVGDKVKFWIIDRTDGRISEKQELPSNGAYWIYSPENRNIPIKLNEERSSWGRTYTLDVNTLKAYKKQPVKEEFSRSEAEVSRNNKNLEMIKKSKRLIRLGGELESDGLFSLDFMEELSFCPEFDINKVEEMGSKSRRVLNAMGDDALVPSVSPDKKAVVFAMLDESISGCIDSLMIIIPDKKIKKTVKVKFKHSPECWVEIGDVEYDGKELIVHFEYDDIDEVLDEVPENPTFTYLVVDNKVKLVSKSE